MNETIRWEKGGVVQNGFVAGATKVVVETSAYVPDPADADRERLDELSAKGSLTTAEVNEAMILLLKLKR